MIATTSFDTSAKWKNFPKRHLPAQNTFEMLLLFDYTNVLFFVDTLDGGVVHTTRRNGRPNELSDRDGANGVVEIVLVIVKHPGEEEHSIVPNIGVQYI